VKRRTAVLSAGIAAGLAAGMIGSALVRRRPATDVEPIGAVPPDELGMVASFDGTEIAVRAAGDPTAQVVILAHGFSLDMSVWCDVWPELARTARVVTLDLRSHGASGRAAHGDLSLRSMGRDIAAVVDAVSPDRPAVLVGHSMGAVAILTLAEQRPELFGPRISGVALIGAGSSDLLKGAMGSVTELLRPRLGTLQAAARRVDGLRRAVLASPLGVSGVVARVTQFGPNASARVVDHVVALAQRTASEVWTDALPELMEMDLRHAVPRVRVPALVLAGELDRVTPPAGAVALAGALPEGRLVLIPDTGHIPMLEAPDVVGRELARVARELAPEPPPRARRKPAGTTRTKRKKKEGGEA
jgi:pimeloyl-ACP methyl ester carboxylesterase